MKREAAGRAEEGRGGEGRARPREGGGVLRRAPPGGGAKCNTSHVPARRPPGYKVDLEARRVRGGEKTHNYRQEETYIWPKTAPELHKSRWIKLSCAKQPCSVIPPTPLWQFPFFSFSGPIKPSLPPLPLSFLSIFPPSLSLLSLKEEGEKMKDSAASSHAPHEHMSAFFPGPRPLAVVRRLSPCASVGATLTTRPCSSPAPWTF